MRADFFSSTNVRESNNARRRIDIKDHEIVEEGEEGYVVVKEFEFVSKVDGGAEGEAPPVVYIAENEDYEEVDDGVDFVVDAVGGDTR